MPKIDYDLAKRAITDLLLAIGEDPAREGLKDTPRRVADFYRAFIDHNPGRTDTVFEAVRADQLVTVSGMRVWSLCEHHLLPFWCDIAIGYIAADRVLGLSKFARIAHKHASRLQLQERLVNGIAEELKEVLKTEDIAVIGRGEHLCMTMRGVRTPHTMTSSAMLGVFRSDASARAEVLALIR